MVLLVAVLMLTAGSAYAALGSKLHVSMPPPPGPDFSIGATPVRTTYRGGAATYEIRVRPRNGFDGTVSLTAQRLPRGMSETFTRTQIPGGDGTATLIVTTTQSAPLGGSMLVITGTSGTLSHTVSPSPLLWVMPTPYSFFTLSLSSQSSGSIGPGGAATYTVGITRTALPGPVALSVSSDLPDGVTASFSPSVTSGTSAGLTLTTSAETPSGSFPFAIEGRSGEYSFETAGTLDVSSGGATSFQIAGSPPLGALLYPGGAAVPVNLVLTNPNGSPITVQSVTMSVTGASPAGCGAANFAVVHQLTAQPVVPAGSTRSLQALGISQSQWPLLRMVDAGNQDVCRNATVHLSFSGSAQG
jgi:hypothetical protein